MSMITESTLEMHFHSALMDLFKATYGLGPTGTFEFFKYSPQLEKFVGFDQAYVRTELSDAELLRSLHEFIGDPKKPLARKFVGYFLQFKVVKILQRRSRLTPSGFTLPYYRCDLRTQRRKASDLSQHETLFSLSRHPGALVYYACPMVFERNELYRHPADLDQLVLAEVSSAPGPLNDNEIHSICFQELTSPPVWCSDPVEGRSISPEAFVERLLGTLNSTEARLGNASGLVDFLGSASFRERGSEGGDSSSVVESLTVVSVSDDGERLRT